MRLDNNEISALREALKKNKSEAYLFGSRVNNDRRGGDIDILVFSKENPLALSRKIARDFFLRCEEKIDVLVMDPDNLSDEQISFLNCIVMEKIND